ncbi:MAG: LysR family transcriptional regulator [Alphaproteobacteria bacterium]|nr:LysR family transcriptional regulator [Alphaproteobacteria bacterium]
MDRLDAMRVFVAVADRAGFAAAARGLGLSAPAATRAIAALERRVGTRLMQRTTRRLRLTEAGQRYLADCKRILGEIDEAEASAAGAHAEPRGPLGITAPAMFGRVFVAPIAIEFAERHPQVAARLFLADRLVDLIDEGYDVAVRIAHLADSALTAVRVGSVRRVICASPTYLAQHGMPRTPADLQRFDAIAFAPIGPAQEWSFRVGQRTQTIRPPARLVANTAEVAVAAAVAGRGLTSVLSYQVGPELRAGKLKLVLADHELPPVPVQVVHHEGRRASARVRAFVDLAVERLRAEKALN